MLREHTMKNLYVSAATLIAATLFSLAVSADSRYAQDLVGTKAKNADPQLQSRGFVRVGTERSDKNHSFGTWWNQSVRQCLTVAYAHGRVEAVTDSPEFDCNQGQHPSSSNNRDEYDRGYSDGLNDRRVNNYNRASAYSEGYQAGTDQRGKNSGHHNQHGSDRGHNDEAKIQARIEKWGGYCKNKVAEQFDVPMSEIYVSLGATEQTSIDSGEMTLQDIQEYGLSFNWEVNNKGRRVNGYCNTDGEGRVTEFKQ
jgi:hypothetical protein